VATPSPKKNPVFLVAFWRICFLENSEFVTEYSVFKKTAIFRQKTKFTDTQNICSTSGVAQEKGKTG
jgi:hypothetical protein